MPKEEKAKGHKLIYKGASIFLVGPDDHKGAVIPFSHTFQDGTTQTVYLETDKVYAVGGKDLKGTVIEDWVYESYKTSDLNRNRVKSEQEIESDGNDTKDGVSVKDLSL